MVILTYTSIHCYSEVQRVTVVGRDVDGGSKVGVGIIYVSAP